MKPLIAVLLLLAAVAVFAATGPPTKKPLVAHGKRRQWTAMQLKARHERMGKVHKVSNGER